MYITPKDKICKCKIYTGKHEDISNFLKDNGFTGFSIHQSLDLKSISIFYTYNNETKYCTVSVGDTVLLLKDNTRLETISKDVIKKNYIYVNKIDQNEK